VTQRAAEADRLLQHPVLQQAFADIKAEAQMMWCATRMTEHEKREELYRVIQTLEMVRAKLLTYRAAGRIKAEQEAA
jgi:alkylation response protein AidB-like acyl-CoA dehydrogenase